MKIYMKTIFFFILSCYIRTDEWVRPQTAQKSSRLVPGPNFLTYRVYIQKLPKENCLLRYLVFKKRKKLSF